jgi:hypothetical protein
MTATIQVRAQTLTLGHRMTACVVADPVDHPVTPQSTPPILQVTHKQRPVPPAS